MTPILRPPSHTLSHTLTHSLSHTLTHTHTHSHAHSHTLFLTHSHTLSHTLTHSHTLSRTLHRTGGRRIGRPVAPGQARPPLEPSCEHGNFLSIPSHTPLEDHPLDTHCEPSALYCWILEILYCNPKGRKAFLRVPSTEGRSVCLSWASSKPKGPKGLKPY